MSISYQPALDGVRALAVVAVLIFHAAPDWLPGGFLGVDAFFVLSGFLITALLLAERERTGSVRLAAFWGRRARRLLPALVAVVAFVAVTARFVVSPDELAAVRLDALAALGYVANWRMIWRGGGYFVATGTPSPLQHTWSLGIEEQFYLLWPLILVFLRGRVWVVAAAGAVVSAVLSFFLYGSSTVDRVYYGTDTRAAALLVGCVLAAALYPLGQRRASGWPRSWRLERVPAWAAWPALLVVAAGWAFASGTSSWLYRGGLLGLAIATATVLGHLVTVPLGRLARLFSLPPLAWLGRVSYGVYLWHWPLFGILTGERTGLVGPALFAVRIGATLAVATVSFYALERPIRRWSGVRWRVVVPAGAAALAVVLALIVVLPSPLRAPGVPDKANAAMPPPPAASTPTPTPSLAPRVRQPGPPRIDIVGDSVAWSLGAYLPAHPGLDINDRAVQGCGIARLPDIRYAGAPHTNYPGCTTWDQRWQASVTADNPDLVVLLLDRWELMDRRLNGRYQHVGDPEYDAYLAAEVRLALTIAGSTGARVVILSSPYTKRLERPDGGLWPEDDPQRVDAWNGLVASVAAAQPVRPVTLDLQAVVCPDRKFTWTVGGVRVRSDGLHFTPEGVRRVIAPWLLPALSRLVAG
jgi:peptidoglycan/LPS O-acetylase OafA/YrhL